MPMSFSQFQSCLVMITVLHGFSSPVQALDVEQMSWEETREEWGQVLFCQRIYQLPGVTSRLYDFDVEHCDKAAQLMQESAAKFSEQDQVQLKNQAERHAFSLSKNTSEPYHSVPACRSYCCELADTLDKRNE